MSDEDESVSEGFSASEDEWKPGKQTHDNGESSDDDDSDFGDAPGLVSGGLKLQPASRKRETGKNQQRSRTDGGGVAKKRKPMGQSLRAKLYNKYRPPPKTFPNSTISGNNSPTASTSRTASKNEVTPNEVGYIDNDDDDNDKYGSSNNSSVANVLVNPVNTDRNTRGKQRSNSKNEDINEISNKAFDFRHLLEKANSLESTKESIVNCKPKSVKSSSKSKINTLDDVTTLLALGEKNENFKNDKGAEEDDEDDDDEDGSIEKRAPLKLNKTKSTRIKRHTKTRPTSQVLSTSCIGGNDTDDSDLDEVAGRKRN